VGFLAGLLGIGGGFTIVPVLMEVFEREGVLTRHVLPLAIGTSSATIVFTAIASTRAHHSRRGVDWVTMRAMAPGLVVGSLLGPQIAAALPVRILAAFFGLFIWSASWKMMRNKPPKADRELPGKAAMFGIGGLIGVIAGMVGTGGAFLAVPFFIRCNMKMQTAVGTSAAIGVPIALAATTGFVYAGWGQPGLPDHSLGYVYLPALIVIALATTMLAPFGARMAHAWPVARLRRAFAAMLFVLGAYMIWKALR
ncbi:MAG: sulfite exporter TauE/SafE family protein, partial [Betaproteobacteria bacterium]